MIADLTHFEGLNVTINTTEDCNLRCKYCYEVNKKPKSISFESCKKFIDLIATTGRYDGYWPYSIDKNANDGIILDFIGGDSLMDPELLDKVLEYFVYKINKTNHPSRNKWRASISTNGTLFSNPKVRRFCEKWRENLSLGVSIDGCPELQDLNRIFPNGKGSMSAILENWSWYKENFPIESQGTKSTLSRDSIPFLYESLVWMHEVLGLKWINQNFIMEDTGCTKEDFNFLDSEMQKCVQYIKEHKNEIFWSMIARNFLERKKKNESIPEENHCGSGSMPCLGIDGSIYPCFRWLPHTQEIPEKYKTYITGTVDTGINKAVFEKVTNLSKRSACTKDPKCWECEYEPCCNYCIGGCFSEYGDFIRTTHICEITKIQAKWAERYWSWYENCKNS